MAINPFDDAEIEKLADYEAQLQTINKDISDIRKTAAALKFEAENRADEQRAVGLIKKIQQSE